MEEKRFAASRTGVLVPISDPIHGKDWAFVPDPLPPNWSFPIELWPTLSDAKVCLGRLDEKGGRLPDPGIFIAPLQKREALRSSSLEGTYASPQQLLLFEMDAQDPKSTSNQQNEWQEVSNYTKALRHGYRRLEDRSVSGLPFSRRLIEEMHGQLLEHSERGKAARPGEFRTTQVHVGSDRRFVPPPPGEPLQRCLNEFESFLNSAHAPLDPLVVSYIAHYQFEAIHPFRDGNGRVGRAILALTTYRWCDLRLPWLYMSPFFERYKDEYIDNLFAVSTHGDWSKWIEFCLRGTVDQCKEALARLDLLEGVRTRLHDRLDGLSPRMHNIVEQMMGWPYFDVAKIMEWCGVTAPTARALVDKMLHLKVIQHVSGKRPRIYAVPLVISVSYADMDQLGKTVEEEIEKSEGQSSGQL